MKTKSIALRLGALAFCIVQVLGVFSSVQGFQTLTTPVPVVAQHPTCPIVIEEVRNLQIKEKNYWQNLEVVVKNVSPEATANIKIGLVFLLPDKSAFIDFRSEVPLPSNQTATLRCTLLPKLNEVFQSLSEKAIKAYITVDTVEFRDFIWIRGDYCRPTVSKEGEPIYKVDEKLENEMLRGLRIHPDWRKQEQYKQYLRLINRDSISQIFGAGGCNYMSTGTYVNRRCGSAEPCASARMLVELVQPPLPGQDANKRLETTLQACSTCFITIGVPQQCIVTL